MFDNLDDSLDDSNDSGGIAQMRSLSFCLELLSPKIYKQNIYSSELLIDVLCELLNIKLEFKNLRILPFNTPFPEDASHFKEESPAHISVGCLNNKIQTIYISNGIIPEEDVKFWIAHIVGHYFSYLSHGEAYQQRLLKQSFTESPLFFVEELKDKENKVKLEQEANTIACDLLLSFKVLKNMVEAGFSLERIALGCRIPLWVVKKQIARYLHFGEIFER